MFTKIFITVARKPMEAEHFGNLAVLITEDFGSFGIHPNEPI